MALRDRRGDRAQPGRRLEGYRWVRRHRLAEPLSRLFGAEAEVLWRLRIAGERPTNGAFIAPEIPPDLPRIW